MSRAWREPPEYLLFTDADIGYAPDALRCLVARARAGGLVLTSLMAKLNCTSLAERALIPAFVFFFQMLYPFRWVAEPSNPTAAAAGGCMLVERRALAQRRRHRRHTRGAHRRLRARRGHERRRGRSGSG